MRREVEDDRGHDVPRRSGVRVGEERFGRRAFLRTAATRSAAAAVLVAGVNANEAVAQVVRPGTKNPAVLREFDDPYIELIRLLREASEVEHALMLQYLYAAFSLKPRYASLRGTGAPNSTDFMGVAVQEMIHLGAVNRLLVALGAAPNLAPQDFPYEPDIYPFEFTLEPLSRASLAKYIYAEAPTGAFNDFRPPELGQQIERALGRSARPNHVGSLYDAVLNRLGEVEGEHRTQPLPRDVDFGYWKAQLARIKNEGEKDHFSFFRGVFVASHPAFGMRSDVWSLPPTDPLYPALPLPRNPSALAGHPNEIQEPRALRIAWLGNLHYWTVLSLLTHGYRFDVPAYLRMAQAHMQGPVLSLAVDLAARGAGMPFEQLSVGYSAALDEQHSLFFLLRMLRETRAEEIALKGDLPRDYPATTTAATLDELSDIWAATMKVQEFRRRG